MPLRAAPPRMANRPSGRLNSNPSARAGSLPMSMSHDSLSLDVSEIYLRCIFEQEAGAIFRRCVMDVLGWPTCSATRSWSALAGRAAANAPLADRLRPPIARRGRRPGASDRARRRDRADGRGGQAVVDDPVGAARDRQDQHRAPAGRRGRPALRRRSRRSSPASPTSRRSSPRPRPPRAPASGPCCSWTKSTASTAPSRTASCPTSRTAPSPWSARRPKTQASNSTPRFCRAARC